ncbi:MAG: hypothetical protein WC735_00465 [Candidatus Paceibacterota bacterium]|jgi:hypothetical protein
MSKNLFQDMVKIKRINREKQTLENEERSELLSRDAIPLRRAETPVQKDTYDVPDRQNNKSRPRYMLWVIAVISLVFFLSSISFLFLKAVVTVNPKMKDVVLNQNFSASLNGGVEGLPFDLIVISGEEEKKVLTTGTKDVSEKARGVVLIYNNFSSSSQRLDVDTRLEGSNGKIYKTERQVTVPGMKGGVPQSVEVGIYAANSGVEYNSNPLDFTILGFKGTPKYSKFYARSKGEITGGFKGKTVAISDAEKSSVINDLKTVLQAKLLKKATDQIPSGFVLFKEAIFLKIDENNVGAVSSEDKMLLTQIELPIQIKGTLYGFLFNEEKLTKEIAKQNINGYDGSDVYVSNIRDLTFSGFDKDKIAFENVSNINFNLSGSAKIVWKLDESKLVTDLLGKSKKDFNQVLLQYPNIDSAELTISPFWKSSLPNKAKNIRVIVNYPK